MKRLLNWAVLVGFLFSLSFCGGVPEQEEGKPRLRVLTSFLPLWAFTKNVVGDRPGVEVDVLIPGHQGPHDYQLTPGDARKIEAADIVILNGYDLEEFLDSALAKARPDLKIVRAGESVLPIRQGGEREHEGDADHGHDHGHGDINPHVFASPRDAARMVHAIALALCEADPDGAENYRRNARAYADRLEALADGIRAAVAASDNPRVVTFHNAFDYLARDSGLVIVGVIETAPGQMPSAGELVRLVEKIKSEKVAVVLSEPQFSVRAAEVVAREAGVPVRALDPAATGEMEPGYYERVMERNIVALREVLP